MSVLDVSRSAPSTTAPRLPMSEKDAGEDGIWWTHARDQPSIRRPKSDDSLEDDEELVRVKRCTHCKVVVLLGAGRSLHAYETHFKSSRCLQEAKAQRSQKSQPPLLNWFKPATPAADVDAPSPSQEDTSTSSSAFDLTRSDCTDGQSNSIVDEPPITSTSASTSLPSSDARDKEPEVWMSTDASFAPMRYSETLCKGVPLKFGVNFYTEYPFHLHYYNELGYHFCAIEQKGSLFRIRSNKCLGMPRHGKDVCSQCEGLDTSAEVERLRKRAAGAPLPGTNYKYYSFEQLATLVRKKNEEINSWKLQCLNLGRKVAALTNRNSDHKLFMAAIAFDDIPALGRLIKVALNQGKGPKEILRRIKLARDGLYSVQSYSQVDYDIASVSLILGGPKCLWALAKAFKIPSLRTVQAHASRTHLLPCLAYPTLDEIQQNIAAAFDPQTRKILSEEGNESGKHGFTVMIDETALDERPQYEAARNAVIGLCRDHSDFYDPEVVSLGAVKELQQLLDNGEIHRAKEASVLSLAPFDTRDYSCSSILFSGTCKAETDIPQSAWISLSLKAWKDSPHGAQHWGPIWCIATDGDAVRRRAVHRLAMSRILQPSSPIYKLLSPLRLMNLQCGEDDITADIDFKHVFKRIATGIRQESGLLVLHMVINSSFLKLSFSDVLKMDAKTVEALFDHRDHQNVPKTMNLLSAIFRLSEDSLFSSLDINKPTVLFGEFLGCLIHPFVDVTMTLSEQLASLSAAVHIFLILFRKDRTSFITGQLAYDIPTFIKNIFFCVAKQKVLNPAGKFFIGQTGSDRLENDFGQYRAVRRSANFDLKQLAENASSVRELSTIFSRNPNWDRGHRRLKLEGAEGVDHTNPASWKGDTCVGNVSLTVSWNSGRRRATDVLAKVGLAPDWANLRSSSPDKVVDILHPNGVFVGIREDSNLGSNPTSTTSAADTVPDIEIVPSPTEIPGASEDSEEVDIELEDVLPEPTESDEDAVFEKPSVWLDVDGKSIHKASVIRFLLSSNTGIKSTDRLRRVRGYSREPSSATLNDDSLIGDNFTIGQVVCAFLRVDDAAAMAVIRTTSITGPNGANLASISFGGFENAKIMISGQVLCLKATAREWVWTKSWEIFNSRTKGKKAAGDSTAGVDEEVAASKNTAVITLPATLVQPLSPDLEASDSSVTWVFQKDALACLCAGLWERVKSSATLIPTKPRTDTFPYRDVDGKDALVSEEGSKELAAVMKEGEALCFMCSKIFKDSKIRDHVATHILAALYGHPQSGLTVPVGTDNPCGFCGRSNTCDISIVRHRKVESPDSRCVNFYKFSLKSAATSTASGPSTNRPMPCKLCQEKDGRRQSNHDEKDVFWSYNLPQHISKEHPNAAAELP